MVRKSKLNFSSTSFISSQPCNMFVLRRTIHLVVNTTHSHPANKKPPKSTSPSSTATPPPSSSVPSSPPSPQSYPTSSLVSQPAIQTAYPRAQAKTHRNSASQPIPAKFASQSCMTTQTLTRDGARFRGLNTRAIN